MREHKSERHKSKSLNLGTISEQKENVALRPPPRRSSLSLALLELSTLPEDATPINFVKILTSTKSQQNVWSKTKKSGNVMAPTDRHCCRQLFRIRGFLVVF